jgi:hypothetical protein
MAPDTVWYGGWGEWLEQETWVPMAAFTSEKWDGVSPAQV